MNDLREQSVVRLSLQASRKLGTKDVKGAKMDKSKRKKHMAHMRKLYGLGCKRPYTQDWRLGWWCVCVWGGVPMIDLAFATAVCCVCSTRDRRGKAGPSEAAVG